MGRASDPSSVRDPCSLFEASIAVAAAVGRARPFFVFVFFLPNLHSTQTDRYDTTTTLMQPAKATDKAKAKATAPTQTRSLPEQLFTLGSDVGVGGGGGGGVAVEG